MSEPGPESIPTSSDRHSKRPVKRRALSPASAQAKQLEALFAKPDREIKIPSGPTTGTKTLPPPPEIVANVQGSSAGAGSGEFHVYKASRRREQERLRLMEAEKAKEEADAEFQRKREEAQRALEERTAKKRQQRQKKLNNMKKKKQGGEGNANGNGNAQGNATKPGPNPMLAGSTANGENRDQEMTDAEVKAAEEAGLIIQDED